MKANLDQVKNLTEEEILNSLENAISLYKTKSLEQVSKNLTKKTKSIKKAKKVSVGDDEAPKVIKRVKKTKNKTRRSIFAVFNLGGKGKRKAKVEVQQEEELVVAPRKGKKSKKGLIGRSINGVKSVSYSYRRQIVTTALTLAMVTFVSYSSYIAYAYMSSNNNDIVEKVSSHIILPKDETPKVYIIQSDKSEIFNNPAFAGIQIGDNVLSYPNQGKVIIYRSKEDKLVNVVNTGK